MIAEPIVRYTMPTKYDVAKFGTICKVVGDNGSCELIVQLGGDEAISNWKPIGYLLEQCFHSFLNDPVFVSCCLHLYSHPGHGCEQLKEIAKIIS